MPGPVFLSGERVDLCTVEQSDREFVQNSVSDSRIWRAIGRSDPYNLEQEGEFFERVICEQSTVHLLVTAEDARVGAVALEGIDKEVGTAEGNYWITPSQWGNGYATEATGRLIQYGFNQRNLHKIVARVTEFDDASKQVLEKIGFVEEERQREQEFVDAEYQDRHWYGLLKQEWQESNDGDQS
jgi:RimJ/RimL family protein N-acetyltransferase